MLSIFLHVVRSLLARKCTYSHRHRIFRYREAALSANRVSSDQLTGSTESGASMANRTPVGQPPYDTRILDRCATLGLSLPQAVKLANANDPSDTQSLLRLLRLDFSTYEPLQIRGKPYWLQMAANSSSVSYRDTLTRDELLMALTTGVVPTTFAAHLGYFLDEVAISIVVFSVAEAAQESQTSPHCIWNNIARLASPYSDHRRSVWAMFVDTNQSSSR